MIGLFALSSTASMCSSQTTTADIQRENAIAFEQEGDNIGAESAWRAFLMSHPANSEAYAHLGLLEARQEHYAQAVPLYRKALALDPKMPGLNLNLGLSLFKSGALKDAVQIFSAILDHQSLTTSETQRLDVLIGMSHYGLGEFAAAVPYLKTAASVDRQSLWIRLTLAQSCLRSKQFPCVLEVYREILALNAESAEADMLAGEALDEMRDHAGAIEQFAAAAKVDPKMPNVHFALGYVLWTQNRLEEAAKEFTAELANTPDHPQALTYLADVDIKLDDLTTAQPLLERAIRSDPRIELAHLDLGIIYANRGRKIEALREMKIAEQQNPNDQNVHWRLARFYKSMGNNEAAKVEFDKTRSVQKAADESISNKLQQAQDHGKTPSPDIDIPNR
jgi:tetratricopeptide (TPR) repeat protein